MRADGEAVAPRSSDGGEVETGDDAGLMPARDGGMAERISHLSSLPFRMALFFAVNPDEELSTADIALKFDADVRDVQKRLKNAVTHGIFSFKVAGPGGRGRMAVYTAGPVLLHMVGGKLQREMIAACMPIRARRVTIIQGQ
jgi:hypothetical protein